MQQLARLVRAPLSRALQGRLTQTTIPRPLVVFRVQSARLLLPERETVHCALLAGYSDDDSSPSTDCVQCTTPEHYFTG